MNNIKYIIPSTGEVFIHRFSQGKSQTNTMARSDRSALKQGFVRAGLRWRGPAARAALKANEIRNKLIDSEKMKRS